MRPQISLRDLAFFFVALGTAAWYISLWQGSLGITLPSLVFLGWSAATVAASFCSIYLMVTGRQRATGWILIAWLASIVLAIAVIIVAS